MTSLLIIAHEEHDKLALHLPALLSQQGTDYDVVVVDMNSEDQTPDLLKSLQESNTHLRYLSLPTSARDISRERLAIHLGMRAATYPRVLLISADTHVPSHDWLMEIEKRWRTDSKVMLIPTLRQRSKGIGDYFNAGHEAWCSSLHQKQALNHKLFRAGSFVAGIHKELFLTHTCPASHLAMETGTMDIFISDVATPYNTTLLTEEHLYPHRDAIQGNRRWKRKRLFAFEVNRHLSHPIRRHMSYIWHCLTSIHRGALLYLVEDVLTYLRWCIASRKTFTKKHY